VLSRPDMPNFSHVMTLLTVIRQIMRMRGSVWAEKQSEDERANESEGRLPKTETAGNGGFTCYQIIYLMKRCSCESTAENGGF